MASRTTTPQGRNSYEPDQVSAPGETLLDVLNERGWTLQKLAEQTGMRAADLQALIDGNTVLEPATANRLGEATGIPSGFWLARQAEFSGKHS